MTSVDKCYTQYHAVHLAALCPIEKAGFRLSRRRCAAESWKAVLPLSLAPPFRTVVRWANGRCTVARAGRGFQKAPLRTEGILHACTYLKDMINLVAYGDGVKL